MPWLIRTKLLVESDGQIICLHTFNNKRGLIIFPPALTSAWGEMKGKYTKDFFNGLFEASPVHTALQSVEVQTQVSRWTQ